MNCRLSVVVICLIGIDRSLADLFSRHSDTSKGKRNALKLTERYQYGKHAEMYDRKAVSCESLDEECIEYYVNQNCISEFCTDLKDTIDEPVELKYDCRNNRWGVSHWWWWFLCCVYVNSPYIGEFFEEKGIIESVEIINDLYKDTITFKKRNDLSDIRVENYKHFGKPLVFRTIFNQYAFFVLPKSILYQFHCRNFLINFLEERNSFCLKHLSLESISNFDLDNYMMNSTNNIFLQNINSFSNLNIPTTSFYDVSKIKIEMIQDNNISESIIFSKYINRDAYNDIVCDSDLLHENQSENICRNIVVGVDFVIVWYGSSVVNIKGTYTVVNLNVSSLLFRKQVGNSVGFYGGKPFNSLRSVDVYVKQFFSVTYEHSASNSSLNETFGIVNRNITGYEVGSIIYPDGKRLRINDTLLDDKQPTFSLWGVVGSGPYVGPLRPRPIRSILVSLTIIIIHCCWISV